MLKDVGKLWLEREILHANSTLISAGQSTVFYGRLLKNSRDNTRVPPVRLRVWISGVIALAKQDPSH